MNVRSRLLLICVWLLGQLSGQTPHWAQMGPNNPPDIFVDAIFSDTIDHVLYIGGDIGYINGKKYNGAARWNGADWDTMQSGFNNDFPGTFYGDVLKILRYKNKIYYFGYFYKAGRYFTSNMAVWNGSSWDSTGYFPDSFVLDADVYNDTLYICGDFTKVGPVSTNCAAKFDGTTWYPMNFPHPEDGDMTAIRVFKNKVYGIGQWYGHGFSLTAEYTQAGGWVPSFGIQGDVNKTVFGLERIDSLLYFFGRFSHLSQMHSPDIAAWSGSRFYGFGSGVDYSSSFSTIQKIKKIKDTIWVVGTFDNAGGTYSVGNAYNVAGLTSNSWCVYNDFFDNSVHGIEYYNNERVIVGDFWQINGDSVKKVATWIGGTPCTTTNFTMTSTAVGIDELSTSANTLRIYPNPASNQLNFDVDGLDLNESEIQISDAVGQVVLHAPYANSLNISSFSEGFYTIRIIQRSGQTFTAKFLKQ